MRLFKCIFLSGSLGLCMAAVAAESIEERLARRLESMIPDLHVTRIQPSPISGIYEVNMGPEILYMTADGKYVFKGNIYDIDGKRNLSEERRTDARSQAFKAQGDDNVIEYAPSTNTRHTLYVYTDIDCGYCQRFHREINQLVDAGIAVRYLAYPRAGVDSNSYKKWVTVWCSDDRQKALTDAKSGRDIGSKTCVNPVAAQMDLGAAMGVRGTPAIYLEDGKELGGYIPAARLIQHFAALDKK